MRARLGDADGNQLDGEVVGDEAGDDDDSTTSLDPPEIKPASRA